MAKSIPTERRVGIYCRVSDDRTGDEGTVKRQETLCRKFLTDKPSWKIITLYVDNDISASKRKTRPQYLNLLADLKSGNIDTVVTYAMDRLYRRPRELEDLVDIVESKPNKIMIQTLTGSDLNLNTSDGVATARILVTLAKRETDMLTKRIIDKHAELAQAGKPHGGERPFGYEKNQITQISQEVKIYNEIVKIFLANNSLSSVVKYLNSKNIKTARGGTWQRKSVSDLLKNVRYAGYREYKGSLYPAVWKPIIDLDTHKVIVSILNDPTRRTQTSNKIKYLLTGLVVCMCGYKMSNMTRGKKLDSSNTYACRNDESIKAVGCGHVRMLGRYVDSYVTTEVLTKLSTDKKVLKSLTSTNTGDHQKEYQELLKEHESVRIKVEEAQDLWAEDITTKSEFIRVKKILDERTKGIDKRISEIEVVRSRGVLLKGEDITLAWEKKTIEEKRSLLRVLIQEIKIKPSTNRGSNKPDASRIEIVWRV